MPVGFVMGPLGLPVRQTLEVGNRGKQKAFLAQVSPTKQTPAVDVNSANNYSNNNDNFHNNNNNNFQGFGAVSQYPGQQHQQFPVNNFGEMISPRAETGRGLIQGNNGFGHEYGVAPINNWSNASAVSDGLNSNNAIREQGLFALGADEDERKKQLRLKQARELEEQIRNQKERQEIEKRKAEADEFKEQERLFKQREEMRLAFEREKEVSKAKAKDDLQKDLEQQALNKKAEKDRLVKEREELDRQEDLRVAKEREALLFKEEEERRREEQFVRDQQRLKEQEKGRGRERDRMRAIEQSQLEIEHQHEQTKLRDRGLEGNERYDQVLHKRPQQQELLVERPQGIAARTAVETPRAHLFASNNDDITDITNAFGNDNNDTDNDNDNAVQSFLFKPQATHQRKIREQQYQQQLAQLRHEHITPDPHPDLSVMYPKTSQSNFFEQKV
jgi:hypothetical protein